MGKFPQSLFIDKQPASSVPQVLDAGLVFFEIANRVGRITSLSMSLNLDEGMTHAYNRNTEDRRLSIYAPKGPQGQPTQVS